MPLLALLCLAVQDRPWRISEDVELRVRVRGWHLGVGGGAKGDVDNSEVEFHEDLDVDAPGWVPSLALGLYAPEDPAGRGVALVYDAFATSGEEELDDAEEFEGSVFPAGSVLRSRLRFLTFGVDGTLAGRDVAEETFAWSFSIGLHYLEAELRLSGAAARESEEYGDGNLKFAVGGELRPFSFAFLAGRIAAYTDFFSLLAGADSGHYGLDAEVSGGIRLAPLRVEVGVRLLAWALNWDESQIDLFAYGPFVGLTLRF